MVYLSCIASVKHKRKSTLRLVAALRLARLPLGPARDTEEGTTWGSWSSNFVQRVRPRTNEKCCAELVEFVIVVVFLMTLLCGIITYVLIQAAQSIGDAGGRRRGTGRLRRLEPSRRHARGPSGLRRGVDEQGVPWHVGHHDHVRRVRAPCPSNTRNTRLEMVISPPTVRIGRFGTTAQTA